MTPTLIDLAEYERVGEGANGASYNHRQDPNIMLKLYFRNFEANSSSNSHAKCTRWVSRHPNPVTW